MFPGSTLLYAFLGGLIPALIWLWFWLREDKKRPEPNRLLFLAFIAGMVTVVLVIPLEQFVFNNTVPEPIRVQSNWTNLVPLSTLLLVITGWSAIEEMLKYVAGMVVVLRSKANDEPIDAIIYMITIALGFAALENTLFILNPLEAGDILETLNIGNLRFIGASVLHTLTSAIVGGALAYSFYKLPHIRILFTIIGLSLAVVLHALFNFTIISTNGESLLPIFTFVWIGVILLIMFFEKIKKIYNRDLIK